MENQKCVLYDRDCIDCGECEFCDLDPTKICDNCGKCLEIHEFATLKIDSVDGVERNVPRQYKIKGNFSTKKLKNRN